MKWNFRLLIVGLAALALGQGKGFGQAPPAPGPEHEILKKYEGTWTAKTKLGDEESTGSVTYKMDLGGLWLSSHFQGSIMGQKFEGRGMDTYDATKKKYVSVWIDSMSTYPLVLEGTYDKETKTATSYGEALGPDGKMAKAKTVLKFKDDDHFTFTMFMVDGGEENKIMTIDYARKK